jgi:hypothetical protein
MAKAKTAITPAEYSGLQAAFEHFNAGLFDGTLCDVFIVYQRKPHMFGYFAPDRMAFRIEPGTQHELALNPDNFYGASDREVCQTLVHEMCHLWQHQYGTPSRRGYHNREWFSRMQSIGLMPSNTGKPGGKETGHHMMDYVIEGGAFATSFAKLAAAGWRLNLQSAARPGSNTTGGNSKTKYTCPACGANAWGKPDLAIDCRNCRAQMVAPVLQAA